VSLRVPADVAAFEELEQLVRSLGEELARFRKRAQAAEARLKAIESSGETGDLFSGERVTKLEQENRDLRARLEDATGRTRAMLERVRFLRQQSANGSDA
jgi:predicted  nucleic acid-binding Zn-ribbon protein